MKDFLTVFRVLYRNRYAVEKEVNTGKRKLPQSTVMILSMLPLVVLICVMLGFAAAQLTTRYSAMTLLNAILSAVQLFILFMMMPSVLGTLYSAEDGAFLSSLPVSPTAVFFAKLLLVYIGALKTAAVFLLPTLLTVSVTYAAFGNPMFYGFFPLIAVIILAAPLLPLFIVVLFSMPVMWIGTYLKGRSVVKTLFSLFFYIVLMVAYMVFMFFVNTEGFGQNGEGISQGVLDGLALLSDVMYPNRALLFDVSRNRRGEKLRHIGRHMGGAGAGIRGACDAVLPQNYRAADGSSPRREQRESRFPQNPSYPRTDEARFPFHNAQPVHGYGNVFQHYPRADCDGGDVLLHTRRRRAVGQRAIGRDDDGGHNPALRPHFPVRHKYGGNERVFERGGVLLYLQISADFPESVRDRKTAFCADYGGGRFGRDARAGGGAVRNRSRSGRRNSRDDAAFLRGD